MELGGLRALVVGCGRIGAMWDRPGQPEILTHAHAYREHPAIASLAFTDHDPAAARRAAESWGGEAYPDLETALRKAEPQVISVCTPDGAHFAVLERILESPVRLILAEKPLALRLDEARRAAARARDRGVVINVNYSRRFDPLVSETRAALRRGEYGKPLNAVGFYTKGILHNGSHMIDMLRYLLGEVQEARALAGRPGHGPADPTLDCWLRMRDCPSVHLAGLEEESYSIHELDLFCERARLRFTRSGFDLEVQTVVADPLFPGYRELSRPTARATGLASAMRAYLDDGLKAAASGLPPLCPAEDAAETLGVCLGLVDMYRKEDVVG